MGHGPAAPSPGSSPNHCPTRVPAFDPSRPLVLRGQAWSGRSDRQRGSSTPSRVTGACRPRPSMADRPRELRRRAGRRAAPGCARPSRRLQKSMSGAWSARFRPGRGLGETSNLASGEENSFARKASTQRCKAPRVAQCRNRSCGPAASDPKRGVRGKPVRARSRNNTPSPARTQGDPKRVKRHEARHSPALGRKQRGPESDVKLGCSFFEKWVIRLKVRRITPRRRPPRRGRFFAAALRPGPRVLDGTREVRPKQMVRRVGDRVSRPDLRRQRRVIPPLRAAWARRFERPAPHP